MSKSEKTKENLLIEGQRLFWTRGFSNVSVREIAQAANVDVALISRYFGSKRGLFEATLEKLPAIDPDEFASPDQLVDAIVEMFVAAPRRPGEASALTIILSNAGDPESSELVREAFRRKWGEPMDRIIGDPAKSALMSAAMIGVSVAEKVLLLRGIAAPDDPDYEAQLRAMLNAALAFERAPAPEPA